MSISMSISISIYPYLSIYLSIFAHVPVFFHSFSMLTLTRRSINQSIYLFLFSSIHFQCLYRPDAQAIPTRRSIYLSIYLSIGQHCSKSHKGYIPSLIVARIQMIEMMMMRYAKQLMPGTEQMVRQSTCCRRSTMHHKRNQRDATDRKSPKPRRRNVAKRTRCRKTGHRCKEGEKQSRACEKIAASVVLVAQRTAV